MNRLELTVKGLRGRGKTTLLRILYKGLAEQGHHIILGSECRSSDMLNFVDCDGPIQPMQVVLHEDPNDLELPVAYTVGQLIEVLGHVDPDLKLNDKALLRGIQVTPQSEKSVVLISGFVPAVAEHRG